MLAHAPVSFRRLASVRWLDSKACEPIRNRATDLRYAHRSECSSEYVHGVMRTQDQNGGNFEEHHADGESRQPSSPQPRQLNRAKNRNRRVPAEEKIVRYSIRHQQRRKSRIVPDDSWWRRQRTQRLHHLPRDKQHPKPKKGAKFTAENPTRKKKYGDPVDQRRTCNQQRVRSAWRAMQIGIQRSSQPVQPVTNSWRRRNPRSQKRLRPEPNRQCGERDQNARDQSFLPCDFSDFRSRCGVRIDNFLQRFRRA